MSVRGVGDHGRVWPSKLEELLRLEERKTGSKEPPTWLELALLDLRDERTNAQILEGMIGQIMLAENHGSACQCSTCGCVPREMMERIYEHCECPDKATEGCDQTGRVGRCEI